MDSATLDSLSDTSTLPDLSFEDYLLDESPLKKFPTSIYSNENDVPEETAKSINEETLNTPEPKRTIQQQHAEYMKPNLGTSSDEVTERRTHSQTVSIDINVAEPSNSQKKTNCLGTPTPPTTPKTIQTIIGVAAQPSTTKSDVNAPSGIPVLLNSKIALSKSSITPQTIVKIATTPRTLQVSSTALTSSTTATTTKTLGTVTTIDGKTALKTANGQIVYLQKGQPKTIGNVTAISSNAIIAGGNSNSTPTAVRIKTAPITGATTSTTNMTTVKITPMVSSAVSGSNTKILTTTTAATANIGGNKTVIQLIRSADGKLLPLKTAGGKGTLTLSPTVAAQLAGKKLIATSSGQIVLKPATSAALNQNTSTNSNTAAESVFTTAKPITIQKIMTPSSSVVSTTIVPTNVAQPVTTANVETAKIVTTALSSAVSTATLSTSSFTSTTTTTTTQSSTAGGKLVLKGTQIVVPSSQIIKLSPGKSTSTSTGNTASSGTKLSGSLHAIQIPGKPGLQYVRVFTAPKKTTTTQAAAENTESTTTTSTVTSPKVLNSVPPKFTVVRPNNTSKIILTKSPKIDGSPVLSPIAANKIKTIVTVPTLRSIASSSDSPSTSNAPAITSVSLIKTATKPSDSISPITTTTSTATNVTSNNGQLRPKPKISEINSEIQRMTASVGEVKKFVSGPDGKRYLVMPRSMLRTAQTATTANRLASGEQQRQQPQNQNQQQQEQQQQQQPKVYSVVKTGSTSSTASASEGAMKSFIICKSSQSSGSSLKGIQVKRPAQQIIQSSESRISLYQRDEDEQRIVTTISTAATQSNNNKFVPIKIKQEPLDGDDLASLMFSDEALVHGGVRRKHCNCSKSQCLKLYCDCFANGEFCQDCTCKDCFNNLQYEDERQRAIKSCLERNPSAFKPKITTSSDQGDTRSHNKGCNCKRSGCLKNYCECFEAKIPCSSNCKCVGCRNIEDRPDLDMDPIDPKLLESITNASNATNTIARAVSTSNQASFASGIRRTYDKAFNKKENKNESDNFDENDHQRIGRKKQHLDDDITGTAALLVSPQLGDNVDDDGNVIADKRNTNFITQEVIDATIQCMISQADECLKNNLPASQIEKMVLEELGRCLVEIIDFSIRNTDTSFSQN